MTSDSRPPSGCTSSECIVYGQMSNGASAIGVTLKSVPTYSTAGAKLVNFVNNATEKLAVDKNGKFIYPVGTADAVAGKIALSGGTITVSTTSITATSIVILTRQVTGGTEGLLRVGAIVAGTSFVIDSANGADTSTVGWLIINA